MIGAFIIPTGIGAEIGGHAGDATPAAKLIASCCDQLIVHPNVVNASDINEMSENMLYVEGSQLDRFLQGMIALKPVKSNKILVAANKPITQTTINAVNAARVTLGIDVKILGLETPLVMHGHVEDGLADGEVNGCEELIEQVADYNFDALAIHTPIEVSPETVLEYFKNGGTNPWGYIEAVVSIFVSNKINKPVAHAPIESMSLEDQLKVLTLNVDPRQAPEIISSCYLQCVLKGLQRAPRISTTGCHDIKAVHVSDVDFMISPSGCFGPPHEACLSKGIPVIIVKENATVENLVSHSEFIQVGNYWEAAGIVMSIKAGIDPWSVRRPLKETIINKG